MRGSGWPLAVVLLAAFAVRAALAFQGGQVFWGDEAHRWHACLQVVDAIFAHHDWREALLVPARTVHMGLGFFVPGVPAAYLYQGALPWLGEARAMMLVALLVGGSGSVAVLVAVAMLAHRLGASKTEVLTATVLTAAASSMTVWARFLTPYDWALALALAAIAVALRPRGGWCRGAMTGALAAGALLTHYGISLVLPLGGLALLWRQRNLRSLGGAMLGGLLVLGAAQVWMVSQGRPRLWLVEAAFRREPQGDVATGWWMPFAYLWDAEHGLALAWAVVVLTLPWIARRRRWLWPVGVAIVLLYTEMAVLSTGLHTLALTGRYVRPLVPFLCLAAAGVLHAVLGHRWWPSAIVLGLVVVQATFNLREPFRQVFPGVLEHQFVAAYGQENLRCAFSVTGPDPGTWRQERPDARWVQVNTCAWLYPVTGVAALPAGKTVGVWSHPLAYAPYQYEVFTARARAILREADLTVRLIDTGT